MRLIKTATMLGAFLCLFSFAAFATPFITTNAGTTCPTPSTVLTYASLPVDCSTGNVNAWFTFSNFVNTPSANNMPIQALANSGFYFPDNSTGPLSFMIGFQVQAVNQLAEGITFDVTGNSTPLGKGSVTVYTCDGEAMSCISDPGETIDFGASLPNATIMFAPTASLGVLLVGNADALSTLTQFETSIIGGTGGTGTTGGAGGNGVPEPATLLLAGMGLLGVGLLSRRRR